MKLLIAENNPTMRRMIRRIVADLAEEIRECDDGVDAVAAWQELRPDWVVMDLHLPRLDGLATTRAILAADPAACVLIVAQDDDSALRAAARAAGARGFVSKERLLDLRPWLEAEPASVPSLPPSGDAPLS